MENVRGRLYEYWRSGCRLSLLSGWNREVYISVAGGGDVRGWCDVVRWSGSRGNKTALISGLHLLGRWAVKYIDSLYISFK